MMSWQKINDYVVADCPEYLWTLTEYRDASDHQMMFVHLDVRVWTKAALSRMLAEFRRFRSVVTCPLYALNPDEDEKWAKFVALFGFKPLQEVICENGARRRLFIHLKDKNNGLPEHADPAAVPEHRI